MIESTYGNRLHSADRSNVIHELAGYIQKALDRGGNVVIPSFAVGRTQEMLYAIREIKQNGLVKGHEHFPVYVDSPLAAEATAIFMQCNPVCFDEETLALIKQGINPIWFDDIRMSMTSEESKQINFNNEPKVIISASGMCEAGRIRHHLKHNLWKENNIILFVGYQAEGSLGRILLNGEKSVTLFGEEITVNAEICSLHGTSGHADQAGLLSWITLKQLCRHNKPIALYNIMGYYDDINYAMEQAMKKNFIRDNCKELYYVTDKLDDLLRYVETPVNKIRTVKELKDG